MTKASMNIRAATEDDLVAINEIYNYYVVNSTATYQTEPATIDERRAWFAAHGERYPVIVAVDEAGAVIGWGSLSRFHPRAAYGRTVENSVYVDHRHHRRGLGRALSERLITLARELGYRTIVGLIDADQGPSIALHRALGFETSGRLREVGYKFGRWLDVVYMQLMVGTGAVANP
ncbi:MAG TPA: GNAT family N-acetyltransferase [Tepidisphaeraceae bacterium]|nr:GNAT family N-acetyltransferase [Tepidisphaeraceae bacterium]